MDSYLFRNGDLRAKNEHIRPLVLEQIAGSVRIKTKAPGNCMRVPANVARNLIPWGSTTPVSAGVVYGSIRVTHRRNAQAVHDAKRDRHSIAPVRGKGWPRRWSAGCAAWRCCMRWTLRGAARSYDCQPLWPAPLGMVLGSIKLNGAQLDILNLALRAVGAVEPSTVSGDNSGGQVGFPKD